MDSPNYFHQYHQERDMSLKKVTPEDSGYSTATPSSSKSTRLSVDYSSSISHRQLSYHAEKSLAGSSMMPLYDSNIDKSFNSQENYFETGISCLDTPNFMSSTRICPTSIEFRRNRLQRSGEVDMDWSPSESVSVIQSSIESVDSGHFTGRLLSGLLISDDSELLQTIDESKSLHETPKKHKISNSSIAIKSHRPTKKSSYLQKLGTPEKNKILYGNLISITPKITKSPERRLSPKKEKVVITKHNLKDDWRPRTLKKNYCGFDKIDFLRLLNRFHVPSLILSYLSDKDLLSVSQVCREWKDVCFDDEAVKKRILEYEESNRINKENLVLKEGKESVVKAHRMFHHNKNSIELVDIQNIQNILPENQSSRKSPPVSPGKRRFNIFMKAASKDGTNGLLCCPRCTRPATLKGEWAYCEGLTCGFVYCKRCLNDKNLCRSPCPNAIKASSPNKDSPIKTNPTVKKSRKNLRRLFF